MMGTETCLGGCMEVPGISLCSQALVHGRHEQFGKRGGDRDASIVVWCVAMSFTFVYCLYFRLLPCLWWQLINCTCT
jgi:hypothetical protein